MRIGLCVRSVQERQQMEKWIGQYCDLYDKPYSVVSFFDPEPFIQAHASEAFDLTFIGLGGHDGVMTTRRLRSMCRRCQIVMIDDTAEHAVAGMRMHVADYMVRPIDFKKMVRAMQLSTKGGAL